MLRKIGYIRVSSTNQNPSRQFQQLNEIGMDIIFEEKVSGATKNREQLQKNVAGFTGRRHYLCYRLNSDHSEYAGFI
ncbi:hypothetical protein CMV37_04585 [Bacillus cereus]|nr:hypothetical protein CMV37_04585 [Bacillus cereus]